MEEEERMNAEYMKKFTHVVFDWDNTLKTYVGGVLRSRLSPEFLTSLKECGVRLFVISAIRPSTLNLSTLLIEVDRLGMNDVFEVREGHTPLVFPGHYVRTGNVIICGYNKAETFMEACGYDAERGDRAVLYDDEEDNLIKFREFVPNGECVQVV